MQRNPNVTRATQDDHLLGVIASGAKLSSGSDQVGQMMQRETLALGW